MRKRRILLIASFLAACGTVSAASFTADDRGILRTMMARWQSSLPHRSAPLVFLSDMPRYDHTLDPYLRLQLLRKGVSENTTAEFLATLADRNRGLSQISALPGRVALVGMRDLVIAGVGGGWEADPRLQNLPLTKTLWFPGYSTDGSRAILLYLRQFDMEDMTRSMTLAYLSRAASGWKIDWQHDFQRREISWVPSAEVPRQAEPTTRDVGVYSAAVQHFGGGKPVLIENQTLEFVRFHGFVRSPRTADDKLIQRLVDRNVAPLYLSSIGVANVRMAQHEEWDLLLAGRKGFGSAAAFATMTLPAYSDDGSIAVLGYSNSIPVEGGVEHGLGVLVLQRSGDRWDVIEDTYRRASGPSPARGDVPIRVGGDIAAPVLKRRVDPNYSGPPRTPVIIEVTIDRTGHVSAATILTPGPPALNDAVLAAVRQWEFEPTILEGKPVAVLHNVSVSFPASGNR